MTQYNTIWQKAPIPPHPSSPSTKQKKKKKKPLRVLNWKLSYDLSRIIITAFCSLFLLSGPPLVPLCEYTASFRGLGADWGPLTWQGKKRPQRPFFLKQPPSPDPKLGEPSTLVKPAGIKAYVSLPSACIRIQASLVCTHVPPGGARPQSEPGWRGWRHHLQALRSSLIPTLSKQRTNTPHFQQMRY